MIRTMSNHTNLIATYGCNRSQLADKMRNNFHIPDEYLGALTDYACVHKTGQELRHDIFDGQIIMPSKTYNVIYNGCTPYHAKRAVEVRLSFRAAKPEFQLEPIVLVQIVTQD